MTASRAIGNFIEFVYCETHKHAVPLQPENKTHLHDEKITTHITFDDWLNAIHNS